MYALITINFEDHNELLMHLSEITKSIKKKKKQIEYEGTKRIQFRDVNCYGSHSVSINLSELPETKDSEAPFA